MRGSWAAAVALSVSLGLVRAVGNGRSASACLLAFDESFYLALTGAPENPADAGASVGLAEQARGCVRKGGTALLFAAGLREALGATELGIELRFIRAAMRTMGENHWRELDAFLVCFPPPPMCEEHSEVALGWHYVVQHALRLPRALAVVPVPKGACVIARASVEADAARLASPVSSAAELAMAAPAQVARMEAAADRSTSEARPARANAAGAEFMAAAVGAEPEDLAESPAQLLPAATSRGLDRHVRVGGIVGQAQEDEKDALRMAAFDTVGRAPVGASATLDEENEWLLPGLGTSGDAEDNLAGRCRAGRKCGVDPVSEAAGLKPWRGAEAVLPDFDCMANEVAEEIWSDIRLFLDSLSLMEASGSARVGGWTDDEHERDIWANYARLLFRYRDAGALSSDAVLDAECPFGFFALQLARWGACLLVKTPLPDSFVREPGSQCTTLRVSAGHALNGFPFGMPDSRRALPVLLNTRWMRLVCQLFAKLRRQAKFRREIVDPKGVVRERYDCMDAKSVVNWEAYYELLAQDQMDAASGDNSTVRFIFASGWTSMTGAMAVECLVGLMTMVLEKLRFAQAMKTEAYGSFAQGLGRLLAKLEATGAWQDAPVDSLSVLMLARWPIFNTLCSVAFQAQALKEDQHSYGYQHKPYELDFFPAELLRSPVQRRGMEALRSVPCNTHVEALRAARRSRASPNFRALLAALETALGGAGCVAVDGATTFKLVVITMIWGTRLSGYLPGSLKRAAAFGLARNSLVFCLDDDSCSACKKAHSDGANCVPGQLKTIYNKYTIISAVVNLGFDALYLDFDTVLMRDPLPAIFAAAQDAEILVSRDFGSDCLNTGVIYFKAHEDTATFLATLLAWLWHHPYEFSQKAFSAFLLVENVTLNPYELPMAKVPRWSVLDPMNQFVTSTVYNPEVEGWTGDPDEIIIYHFLDGTGGVDPERAVAGEYINLYDLFFANPSLDLADVNVSLWRQDPRVHQSLLRSRRPAPPSKLYPCMLYPDAPD